MLRVVITGPESSGKTTLASLLAAHFYVPFVSEFAREYLETKLSKRIFNNHNVEQPLYKKADLNDIYLGQLKNESSVLGEFSKLSKSGILICDTDAVTIKIWSDEVFGSVDPQLLHFIESQLHLMNNRDDLTNIYLLCSPEGIEWEEDPLRENPADRDRLFGVYIKNLKMYNLKYFILRGSQQERLAESIDIINELE